MIEIALVATLALVAAGLGWPAASYCVDVTSFRKGERILFSVAMGLIAIATAVYLVSWIRLDRFTMGGFLALAALGAVPGLKSMPWREWALGLREIALDAGGKPLLGVLWALLILVALSGMIQGLAPPADYDSLNHHLSLVRRDIEEGRADTSWAWESPLFFFLPTLMGALTRMVWVLASIEAAQVVHGLFALLMAGAAGTLAIRLGGGKTATVLAALFILGTRVVVWEMGTAMVDLALAAFSILSLLAYLVWRERPTFGSSVLFGVMLGGALGVKYHGLGVGAAFAPLIAFLMLRDRKIWGHVLVIGAVAFLIFSPYGIRNAVITGNPVFPFMNSVFARDYASFDSERVMAAYGMGHDIFHMLTVFWDISVRPLYFDGMMLGAPYLLALAPAAALSWRKERPFLESIVFVLVYAVLWFWVFSQQVRFLLPVLPVLAAFAAVGVEAMGGRLRINPIPVWAFLTVTGLLAANQSIFIASYAAIRLPPALGLMSAEEFFQKAPRQQGAHYDVCRWLEKTLKTGEKALLSIHPQSAYCPQKQGIYVFPDDVRPAIAGSELPELGPNDLLNQLKKNNVRYIVVEMTREEVDRSGKVSVRPLFDGYMTSRYGKIIGPVLRTMRPIYTGAHAAAYDGSEVEAAIREAVRGRE